MPALRSQQPRSALAWVLFGLQGRISRHVYWLASLFLIALNSALLGQLLGEEQASYFQAAQTLAPFVVLATIFCNVAVAVKRLHDLGYTGFLALALVVPFVNLAFSIWVGILPGTPGPNRFGAVVDAPPP